MNLRHSGADYHSLPLPDDAQSAILTAAISQDSVVVADAFERWKTLTDLTVDVDGGTYRLMPLLYVNLKKHSINDDLLGMLKGVYRRTWYENRILLHKVEPVLRVLQDAGIQTLVLKGVPLALSYYPSVAVRPMRDIDIVVHPGDLEDALDALRSAGWSTEWRTPLVTQHPAISLNNPEGEALVDLHWHPLSEVRTTAAEKWFWSDTRPLQVGDTITLQPNPTVMLLHVMAHGMRSNHEPPIRWIADAANILQVEGVEPIDWGALVAFAVKAKLSFRIHLALQHLHDVYGIEIPAWVLTILGDEKPSLAEKLESRAYLSPLDRNTVGRSNPIVLLYIRAGILLRAPRLLLGSPVRWLTDFLTWLTNRWKVESWKHLPMAAWARVRRKPGLGDSTLEHGGPDAEAL